MTWQAGQAAHCSAWPCGPPRRPQLPGCDTEPSQVRSYLQAPAQGEQQAGVICPWVGLARRQALALTGTLLHREHLLGCMFCRARPFRHTACLYQYPRPGQTSYPAMAGA